MKKYIATFLCFLIPFCMTGCQVGNSSAESVATASAEPTANLTAEPESAEGTVEETTEGTSSRILIAYFSRADENYGVGYIEKGNTAIIAELIAEQTDGELYHIERSTPYPVEYDACTGEAKREQNENARPELLSDHEIDAYDIIFVGYPIWWGDMPMTVYTWLEAHDFAGKTIIPFCTHAGSGLSGTADSMQSVCPGATLLDGLAITGATAQNNLEDANATVLKWLEDLNLN